MRTHNRPTVKLQVASALMMVCGLVVVPVLFAQIGMSNTSNIGSGVSNTGSNIANRSNTSNFGSNTTNFGSSGSGLGDSGASRSLRDRDSNRDSDRRGRSDRKSRRDSSAGSGLAKPEAAAAGVPARAASQAATPRTRSGGRGAGGEGSYMPEATTLPEYKISSLIQSDSLYFSPAEIDTPRGWRFASTLNYFNAGGHPVDRMDLWLKYAPELLDPVSLNLDGLRANGATEVRNEVYREQGYLRVLARFGTPVTQLLLPVGTINWQAVAGPATAFVHIEAPPGRECGIFAAGGGALYNPQILNRGLVSLRVRIGDALRGHKPDDPAFRWVGDGEDPIVPASEVRPGVRLGLLPKSANLRPGEVSTLDVAVINPALVEFDRLHFRLRFNPEEVEILDADEDNYITRGVNIYDGGFHDRMPFDLHHVNSVDSRTGTIEYSVGSLNGAYPYPSGTVARVVFRVRRDAGTVVFWFDRGDTDSMPPPTDIRTRGRSVLGDPHESASKALHNAMLTVGAL